MFCYFLMEKVVTRQLFRNLNRFTGQSIELSGWVRNNRAQKSFGFLMINDVLKII